jgi:Cof subfamily protein (haloacid dehalogenase superfamily)
MSAHYRLIACDLDGTLVGPDLAIAPRDAEALDRARALGCEVAIATGRMLVSAETYCRALAIRPPVIGYNGAWTRCHHSGLELDHSPIPADWAQEAIAALEAAGLHVNLYLDDAVQIVNRSPEADAYLAHARVEARWLNRWDDVAERPPTKILAIGAPERLEAVHRALAPRFEGRLWFTRSMPTFLELTRHGVDKGVALARLAAHLGIAREHVVAVGDGLNDAEMIAWAGLGVAMGGASDALKAKADRVTGPVEANGVAELIDALIAEGALG